MHISKKTFLGMLCILCPLLPVYAQTRTTEDFIALADHRSFRNKDWCREELDFNRIDHARLHALIFFLTNEIRDRNHLSLVGYARELENSAIMHAQDMVRYTFFSHMNNIDAAKKTPNDRAILCRITNPYLAENIMEGYGLQYTANETVYLRGEGRFSKTPEGALLVPHTYLSFTESLIAGWMNSKAHRKNILAKEAVQLGCGVAYFTDREFNKMPSFKAVQNFQWYERIVPANH